MKSLAIIPARAGSKGIPGKNYKILNGKPLISYTIEAALESKIDKIIVSTNCPKVTEIANSYSIQVITRPETISGDKATTLEAIQHVLNEINNSEIYTAILTLQPTSPFRRPTHINESLEIYEKTECDSLVSVVKVPHNFSQEKVMILESGLLKGDRIPKRRQEIKERYARNGAAIYISSPEILNTSVMGDKIAPYYMDKISSIDIDDMDDWLIAEAIMSHKSEN